MDQATQFFGRAKWALALVAVPVVAVTLYLLMMFVMGLGLVATAAGAALGGAICLALVPAVSEALTVLKHKSFKAVVAKFPIESLDGDIERGAKHLKRAYDALVAKGTEVEAFRAEVQAVEREHPEDAAEAREELSMIEQQMAFHMADWVEQERVHNDFVKEVAKQKRRWRLAMAGKKLRESLQIKQGFEEQLRRDTAFEAITRAHSESIAHLKMSRDIEYMRKRAADAVAANKPLPQVVYDQNNKVVLPQIQEVAYVEKD